MIATGHVLAALLPLLMSTRSNPPLLAVTNDAAITGQLDEVPVFGILIADDSTLYGDDDGNTIVYTHLEDANRVLAQAALMGSTRHRVSAQQLTLTVSLNSRAWRASSCRARTQRPC